MVPGEIPFRVRPELQHPAVEVREIAGEAIGHALHIHLRRNDEEHPGHERDE